MRSHWSSSDTLTCVLLAMMIIGSLMIGLAVSGAKVVEANQKTHFPEPDYTHNGIDRTCFIHTVPGRETQQYWQCSDGCEYIGYWKVKTPDHLVCPKGVVK